MILDVLDIIKWVAYVSCTFSFLFCLYIAWHCFINEALDARWRRKNNITRTWGDSDLGEWL